MVSSHPKKKAWTKPVLRRIDNKAVIFRLFEHSHSKQREVVAPEP